MKTQARNTRRDEEAQLKQEGHPRLSPDFPILNFS